MTQSVLILGGRGRFGRNATLAFERAGWTVHQFDRERDILKTAMRGMDVVVNAWNPGDYSKWADEMLPLHSRVIDAARGSNVTLIVPGNVYVYGEQAGPWSSKTPHCATNALGQLRVEMEAAYRASGLQVILLRAGDFLDTEPSDSWFDKVLKTKLHRGILTYPGREDAAHAWAYLPDLARAAVALAEKRAALPIFSDVPFPGYTVTARQMADALTHATGRDVRVKQMAWWPLRMLAPVVPMLRGLNQMRYLWDTPHSLDNTTFDALLPNFKTTPIEDALSRAIGETIVSETALRPQLS